MKSGPIGVHLVLPSPGLVLVELMLGSHVLGLLSEPAHVAARLILGLGQDLVDVTLVLVEEGENHLGVDDGGSVGLDRCEAPAEEEALGEPVEGEPADSGVGEVLDDGEEGEDDPVDQPAGLVVLVRALQGLDGAVGRVGEPYSHGQELEGQREHDALELVFVRALPGICEADVSDFQGGTFRFAS